MLILCCIRQKVALVNNEIFPSCMENSRVVCLGHKEDVASHACCI